MLTGDGKIELIRSYAKHPTLVETGSAHGPTVAGLLRDFDRIFTVDIAADNYETCILRFWNEPHVTVLHGDSAVWIVHILHNHPEPAVFWLDAHYDYDGRADRRGSKDTPIEDELFAVLSRGRDDVVLVDDARLFGDKPGYPTVDHIASVAGFHGFRFELADDVMRLTRPEPETVPPSGTETTSV